MALGLSLGAVDVVIAGIGTAGGGVMLLCLFQIWRWRANGRPGVSSPTACWPASGQRFAGRRALPGARCGASSRARTISTSIIPPGVTWVYRILWVCGVMAGLVVLSYLILKSASGRRQCALVRLRALYRLRHVRHFCGDDRRRISCMALLSGRNAKEYCFDALLRQRYCRKGRPRACLRSRGQQPVRFACSRTIVVHYGRRRISDIGALRQHILW